MSIFIIAEIGINHNGSLDRALKRRKIELMLRPLVHDGADVAAARLLVVVDKMLRVGHGPGALDPADDWLHHREADEGVLARDVLHNPSWSKSADEARTHGSAA